jgi:hypothetical protein
VAKSANTDAKRVAEEVAAITDAFCDAHLDAEYRELCRRLVAKLARKKESPLVRGEPRVWAAAVVHVIGWVNFLFDKTQKPHMRAAELCERAGVSNASVDSKSREIRKLLKIVPMEPEWFRLSQIHDNPFAWMVQVNGLVLDARMLPEHVQTEARERGIIPDLPSRKQLMRGVST